MGIKFKVKNDKFEFALNEYEIRGFEFIYNDQNAKYAKSPFDERILKVEGDISRIIEKNEEIFDLIRGWAKTEYKDKTYYSYVETVYTYRETNYQKSILK